PPIGPSNFPRQAFVFTRPSSPSCLRGLLSPSSTGTVREGTRSSKQQSPPRPVPSSLVSLQLYQTFPICMPGSVRASQAPPIKPLSKKSAGRWCMPVVPATWEAEAGGSLEPRSLKLL
uniref:Uncharacterized protein n=1 Tax=Prolemur simus TaxID=1328070 RepID=A0A8C9A030_PROSS